MASGSAVRADHPFEEVQTSVRGTVAIDMGEIHDHGWMAPADAIRRRDAGDIELSPPTWIR